MKKILMICPFPFLQYRGSPLLVYNCVTALSELGYYVDLLCFPLGHDPKIKNVNVYMALKFTKNIPIGFSWMKPFYDFLLLLKAIKFRVKNSYDIIHGQHFEGALIAAIVKGRLSLYYTIHSLLSEEMKLNRVVGADYLQRVFKFFEKIVYRISEKIFPVSPSFVEVVGKYSKKNKCLFIPDIPPSVELKKDIIEYVSKFSPGKVKFMYAGNLSIYQGIDILIEAFQNIDACLLIIGGDDRVIARYRKYAEKCNVNDIFFLGPQPAEDIPSYLQAADVLISPRLEGSNIPSKIYTYINVKKPIILTEIEAHIQIERDSFLFCKSNPEDLQNKIKMMLDINTRKKYQKKVAEISGKFTRQAYLNLLKENY